MVCERGKTAWNSLRHPAPDATFGATGVSPGNEIRQRPPAPDSRSKEATDEWRRLFYTALTCPSTTTSRRRPTIQTNAAARTARPRVAPTPTSPFGLFLLLACGPVQRQRVLAHTPQHWVGGERALARRLLDLCDVLPESLLALLCIAEIHLLRPVSIPLHNFGKPPDPSIVEQMIAKPFVALASCHDGSEFLLICTLRLLPVLLRPRVLSVGVLEDGVALEVFKGVAGDTAPHLGSRIDDAGGAHQAEGERRVGTDVAVLRSTMTNGMTASLRI